MLYIFGFMTYSEEPFDVGAVPAHSSCCLMVVAKLVALSPHRVDKTDTFLYDFPFYVDITV